MSKTHLVRKPWRSDVAAGDVLDADALGLSEHDVHFLIAAGLIEATGNGESGEKKETKKRKD